MKSFVALFALVAVVVADVAHLSSESQAQVLKQSADVFPDQYQYIFKTSNGIDAQESGVIQNPGTDAEAIAVQGSNSYPSPDGEVISITYVAGVNGYEPQGAHLPTPPPPQEIPDYILRSIEYIRTHAPKPEPNQRS